jgi:hypothetical protein
MLEALFHPAFWMPLALAIVGIGVFIYGNNRVNKSVQTAGLGILGLTLAWCVAAYLVQTTVEQCLDRTRAITAAVEAADWPKLKTLLDQNTNVEGVVRGPNAIATATQVAAENYGLKDIRILTTNVVSGGNLIDVSFTAMLDGTRPTTSNWKFQYEKRSDGILLARIVPISIGGVSMDEVRARIPK